MLSWEKTEIEMSLGLATPFDFHYTPPPGETQAFLRARGISVSAPEDWDNDGMDDIWELMHPEYLNVFVANDANGTSPAFDALPGETNLEYYRRKRGIVPLKQVFTREISIFNFGAAISQNEAISRPISLFNGESAPTSGIQEVYSREVTSFNFGSPLASFEAVSRAATIFNFGSPLAQEEAISRAVSIFNGSSVPDGTPEVYSREITAFNFGAPTAGTELISRAISVQNTQ